jgi:hypothetical protein
MISNPDSPHERQQESQQLSDSAETARALGFLMADHKADAVVRIAGTGELYADEGAVILEADSYGRTRSSRIS